MKIGQKRTADATVAVSDSTVASAAAAVPSEEIPFQRRLEREAEVCRRTGRHRSSIWRDVRSGLMPSPVRIGLRVCLVLPRD
jgi:hypothetical protein